MVATGCTRGKVQATGREFDVSEMHLWTIEDGRVVRFESYIDSSMMCEVWRL
jgi:ketosteroid isomerase-like protein